MEDCDGVSTPMNQKEKLQKDDGAELVDEGLYRSLIGCLMYLTTTKSTSYFLWVWVAYEGCKKEWLNIFKEL